MKISFKSQLRQNEFYTLSTFEETDLFMYTDGYLVQQNGNNVFEFKDLKACRVEVHRWDPSYEVLQLLTPKKCIINGLEGVIFSKSADGNYLNIRANKRMVNMPYHRFKLLLQELQRFAKE